MLGRAAYQSPAMLREVDRTFYGDDVEDISYEAIVEAMIEYCEGHLSSSGRLHQVTRHMIGLFQGVPGARRWRQILSSETSKEGAGPEVLQKAFCEVANNGEMGAAA